MGNEGRKERKRLNLALGEITTSRDLTLLEISPVLVKSQPCSQP
jgi:hypothetical protein